MEESQESKDKKEFIENIINSNSIEYIKNLEQKLDDLIERRNFMRITDKTTLSLTEGRIKENRKDK